MVLCHELYRFTYPVEPYAGIVHTDPIGFATDRIARLLRLADQYGATVAPYETDLEPWRQPAAERLERATSDLYSELWRGFDEESLTVESLRLLESRLPPAILARRVRGRRVLDMGCGSGRYSLALALSGAAEVVALDVQAKSFAAAAGWAAANDLPVEFLEANVLDLPLPNDSFDFVFCNGVLHHSESIESGLGELARVLRPDGAAFLYLYGSGGIFWNTRTALRGVFADIPLRYTQEVLSIIGMPPNRFIFCDTWYVPVETLSSRAEVEDMLARAGLHHQKVVGESPFDLDRALEAGVPGAAEMWGDGEHRYLLTLEPNQTEGAA